MKIDNYYINRKGRVITADGSKASTKAHVIGFVWMNIIAGICMYQGYLVGKKYADDCIEDLTSDAWTEGYEAGSQIRR